MMNSAFLDDTCSLKKPEFVLPASESSSTSKQQRFCWCMPVAISFLLVLLLGVTSAVMGVAEIKQMPAAPPLLLLSPNESTIQTCESLMLASQQGTTIVLQTNDEDSLHYWMTNIVKPILIEVGALALFQSMGALPMLTKLLFASKRSSKLLRLVATKKAATRLMRGVKWRSPRLVRRLHDSAKRLYRSRSRLSAASDITHVIGDDTESANETTNTPDTTHTMMMVAP